MLKILLTLMTLILAIPAGYLLAYLTKDELKQGRKWFKLLAILSLILGIIFSFFNLTISLSLAFIFIVSFISYWKSGHEKFLK
jgi:ABC-type antimicrobial peptide transport system permease subunit